MTPSPPETHPSVSLWAAKIPVIGQFALHHWFVITRGDKQTRWEVWQSTNAGGKSWGHLHLDLMPPTHWPHKDQAQQLQVWRNEYAVDIVERIESSPQRYIWCHKYRYWPGPNSNTWVQWVLQQEFILSWRSPGKNYVRFA